MGKTDDKRAAALVGSCNYMRLQVADWTIALNEHETTHGKKWAWNCIKDGRTWAGGGNNADIYAAIERAKEWLSYAQ